MKTLTRFLKDESGATMVEYGLLVALISVVAIVIIFTLGNQIANGFQEVSECLADPGTC
ncbi:MAG: Flp family type IVb pilin [Gammaproteobacteria bacterium]|nr:Flp family type IVb pilin [Gammaproteobacteria bacterium]